MDEGAEGLPGEEPHGCLQPIDGFMFVARWMRERKAYQVKSLIVAYNQYMVLCWLLGG